MLVVRALFFYTQQQSMKGGIMNKNAFNTIVWPFIVLVVLANAASALADPVVPGFTVEVYANLTRPVKLAFDPNGVLYVGNNGSNVKIYRIGLGGYPIEEYGDTPLPDPDSVAFDASGAISGTPGSVLVGNGNSPDKPGFIAAILPDQTTITALGPKFGLGNPAHLDFDRTGRLLIADQNPPFRALAATPNEIIDLGPSFLAITADGSNRVYSSNLKYEIIVIASDGTRLPDLTSHDNSKYYFYGLEFGPYDSVWKGHLFVYGTNGNIYRIKSNGSVVEFGSGFSTDTYMQSDLAFGPDDALYVSDYNKNVIYRITPGDDFEGLYIDFNSGADGFEYSDDIFFNTNRPQYASGYWTAKGGNSGSGGLFVGLGDVDGRDIMDGMSGGWTGEFYMSDSAKKDVSIDYRMVMNQFDVDECAQALVQIGDGDHVRLIRLCGRGTDTGWITKTFTQSLSAGDHTIKIGGVLSKKTGPGEVAHIYFDNIKIK
jgi:hypothetical protein